MGSKGRIPPPHLRRPLPGSGMVHPDAFGAGLRQGQGAFSPFDMLPPPEVMEQKLAAQHVEMQRLAAENQRLASTHGTLRQELAAAQHELQVLHGQIGAMKSDKEQQMRGLVDKIAKIETELQTADSVKSELQQTRSEAQSLVVAREELISKVRQLSQDLQKARSDVQQIPALMSELEGLRQEYQRCRATYDYEKKFYNDHLESLQAMEKNYMTMAREVEKLRAELMNSANVDRRAGGPYGGTTVTNENEGSVHQAGQNPYEDGYAIPQGHGPLSAGTATAAIAGSGSSTGANATAGTPGYVGAQSGQPPPRAGYEASRGPGYDASRGTAYDGHRGGGPGYDPQRGGPGYDAQRGGPGYDAQRGGPGYDAQRGGSGYDAQRGGPGYDAQRGGPGYEAPRGQNYDAVARGVVGPHGQMTPSNNIQYGSMTPPSRPGGGYEAAPRGGNPVRR